MNNRDDVFPPNANEIRAHLNEDTHFIYGHLELWTCDQAAQVVSGIDPYGFNQDDADYFIRVKTALQCVINVGKIDVIENEGKVHLKPLDVLDWAIADAMYEDNTVPEFLRCIYKDKLNKLNQLKTFAETGAMVNKYQEPVELEVKVSLKQNELLIDEIEPQQIVSFINHERNKDAAEWVKENSPDLDTMTNTQIKNALQARDLGRSNKIWAKGFTDWNRVQQVWPKKNPGRKLGG
jgi:hypothetical protein